MKLAVLICDTPADKILQEFGDYYKLFNDLLSHPTLSLFPFDAVKSKLPVIDEFDAFLITGSKYSANDNDDWILKLIEFLVKVKETRKKVVGICFGHQLIARAFGGRVEKNQKGWEIGLQQTILTEGGKKIYGVDTLHIQEMHQDHVVLNPKDIPVVGGNDISPIQIMISPQFYCLQGHPEYSAGFVDALIKMRLEKGIFTKELIDKMIVGKDQNLGTLGTDLYKSSIWRFLGLIE